MPTGNDILQWLYQNVKGHPYNNSWSKRTGPDSFDCSGAVWAAHNALGVEIPSSSSMDQERFVRNSGLLVADWQGALAVPGMLLFRTNHPKHIGPDGKYQNHVAAAVGDGVNVMEAQGTKNGCGVFRALGRDWTSAGRVPGVEYVGGALPVAPPVVAPPPPVVTPPRTPATGGGGGGGTGATGFDPRTLARTIGSGPTLRKGNKGQAVREWQAALVLGAGQPIAVDGDFGPQTDRATRSFQAFLKLTVDGVVGSVQTRPAMAAVLRAKYGDGGAGARYQISSADAGRRVAPNRF